MSGLWGKKQIFSSAVTDTKFQENTLAVFIKSLKIALPFPVLHIFSTIISIVSKNIGNILNIHQDES